MLQLLQKQQIAAFRMRTVGPYMLIYRVATISKLLKIMFIFCRIQSLLWGPFAKETYNLKEPTHRSHPIVNANGHLCIAACCNEMQSVAV